MKMRKDTKTNIAGGSSSRRGFALLITITLLAFLVLLLVSLASLTRVETQVASNNQKMAQARQNAIMALNIAVGQLQKYAGPDNRVTATAALTGESTNPNLTGIWTTESATAAAPDVWLVSGADADASPAATMSAVPNPLVDVTAGTQFTSQNVMLVGDRSVSKKENRIQVKRTEIKASAGSVPGMGAATPVIGYYGWWVGDQGVKASVGLADRTSEVTYGPWADADSRARIRQQIGSSPNYFKKAGTTFGFDPLDTANKALMPRVQSNEQISMLTAASSAPLTTYLKDNFHDVTMASYSVLANTEPSSATHRGLMQDLSMMPSLLGTTFVRYANYPAYMDSAAAGTIQRKYKMQEYTNASANGGAVVGLPRIGFNVAPILSDFLLRVRVSRLNNDSVTVRTKLFVSLWNPYTASLVPEDIYLVVTGLPTIDMEDASISSLKGTLNLQDPARLPAAIRGDRGDLPAGARGTSSEIRVKLSFDASTAGGDSWPAGRVYSWATDASNSATLKFNTQDSQAGDAGWAYQDVPQLVGGTSGLKVAVPAVTTLRVKIITGSGQVLAENYGLNYSSFSVGTNNSGWKFGYGFRVYQPHTLTLERKWRSESSDLRASPLLNNEIIPFDSALGTAPAQYNEEVDPSKLTQYLIYRPATETSAGVKPNSASHDVPMFELPRQPFLSIGELQHMILPGSAMFSIGNSWGATTDNSKTVNANTIFDRFFFSGLIPGNTGPDFSKNEPLPNPNMRVSDGVSLATLMAPFRGFSSAHLLQGGGFNINSTSVAAWRAVLSRTRFASSDPFMYAKMDTTTGRQTGTEKIDLDKDPTLGSGAAAPVFFRFPQSAQETMDWVAVSGREMSTQTFRQGIRGGGDTAAANSRALTTTQLETLAGEIVKLVKLKAAASGPFRSMSEFLNPNAAFSGTGLLEKAIVNSSLNPIQITPNPVVTNQRYPGYGALTLTAADIMTALAPYAKTRSDTFTVRAYGDAVNPVTGTVESRAYVEAVVQRMPIPVSVSDSSNNTTIAQPAGAFGRRFKITSFRWLSASDI